jgi:hypothetical protein
MKPYLCSITSYILGLICVPFPPETRGKPLPESNTLTEPGEVGHQPSAA